MVSLGLVCGKSSSRRAAALSVLVLASCSAAQPGVGFRTEMIGDPQGPPIEIGVWYPSSAPAGGLLVELQTFEAAPDGEPVGRRLPLIVMSHGAGGSFSGHADTAMALARAGFVAAALTHTGDNFRDQSRATDMADRPRQLELLVDHMLTASPLSPHLDGESIGAFGFSSGGFTVLALAGGEADLSRIGPHCSEHPDFFDCTLSGGRAPSSTALWVHDARIKAVVSAAPALGFTFGAEGLSAISAPVQLWRAEDDEILPHPHYAEAVREALPTPPDYHVVERATHFAFLAPCTDAARAVISALCEDPSGFDRAAFHEDFNREVVRFFRTELGKSQTNP